MIFPFFNLSYDYETHKSSDIFLFFEVLIWGIIIQCAAFSLFDLQISLLLQLSYFKNVVKQLKQKLGNAKTEKLLMGAVYLFSIGGNDYGVFQMNYPNASLSHQREYVGMVIQNLTSVLEVRTSFFEKWWLFFSLL